MLTISIIDDEPDARNLLRSILTDSPNCKVVSEATSTTEAITLLKTTAPDVVFLDIDLSDGTGFEVLEKLPNASFSIIFVTAFDQFALKAFQANAIDYLLKPVYPQKVKQALEKVRLRPVTHFSQLQMTELLKTVQQKKVEKLLLHTTEGIHIVPLDQILYLQSEGSYTHVFTVNSEDIMVSKHLGTYAYLHTEGGDFCRVHQSYIVNLQQVRQVLRSHDGNFAVMSNGAKIPISRREKDGFISALETL
jgi:two-component system, LytTR family, response regulator